jgi:limonene-1,2-epoxide hydrolase
MNGTEKEAVVKRFMDAWGDGTQEEPDTETILSMFTEDAEWQLWIPGGPILRGREAIGEDIRRQLTFATFMRCGLRYIGSNDQQVFTERSDQFVSNGVTIDHHLVAIFDVTDDGLISGWREYFDPGDVNRQLREARGAKTPPAE